MGQSIFKFPKLIFLKFKARTNPLLVDSAPDLINVSQNDGGVSIPPAVNIYQGLTDLFYDWESVAYVSAANSNEGTRGKNDIVLSKQGGGTVEVFKGELAHGYGLERGIEKHGERVHPSEAAAMKLVEQYADVPAPKLLDSYFDGAYGQLFMTLIPGQTLEVTWSQMNEEQKEAICHHLWILIENLRKVPRPPELAGLALCLADGSPSNDPLVQNFNCHDDPLRNDDDVRNRIYERYYDHNGRKYEKILPDMLPRSSRSVFTHADITPRNIMIDDGGNITGILDWERAGWYPDYWEIANITAPAGQCGDWQDWMIKTAPRNFKCDLQGIDAARGVLF